MFQSKIATPGGFPELWRTADWNEALQQFQNDLTSFGVTEV